MSKGANFINLLNPPKSDGHKIINVMSERTGQPTVFCPKIKPIKVSRNNEWIDERPKFTGLTHGYHTSNGVCCGHCGNIIH